MGTATFDAMIDCEALMVETNREPDAAGQAPARSGHGVRTASIGVESDPAALETACLPETASLIVPTPPDAMRDRPAEANR